MRKIFTIALLLCSLAGALSAQDTTREFRLLDYHDMTDWIPETPGVTSGAVGGFINPAAWSTAQASRPEFAFWWNDRSVRSGALDNWGFATSGWLSLGANSQVFQVGNETYRVTDWQMGISGGDRRGHVGLAFRWATDDADALGRENAFIGGMLSRPNRFTSIGAVGTWSTKSRARNGVFDLGLRPLGNDRLVVYGDYTLTTTDRWDDGRWGAGVTFKPIAGLHLGVTARDVDGEDGVRWIANVGVNLLDTGFHWLPSYDTDGELSRSTFLLRNNPPTPNLPVAVGTFGDASNRYAAVNLENKFLTYQRYQYFDNRRVAWLDLEAYLEAVEADDRIGGLVLNLTDFSARPSLTWEFRKRLERLQAAGKEIVILVSRVDIRGYYLVSVADHLMLDPQGTVGLQGVASGRTYLRDMLAKIGLGYQEMRYFKYKSAAEVGTRMDMSEGEREQRQRMVDVMYEEVRRAICASRNLTLVEFDALVDDEVAIWPKQAQDRGLVDSVGRHADLMEWLAKERQIRLAPPSYKYRRGAYPETHWGEPAQVAVVYAVGGCLMDEGIKGRATSRYLNSLIHNDRVKAVVLRADSPGGDPLPSDLVAGAMRNLIKAGKPVIVSQGDVAASGGYWISMDGEEILTTPLTITGSIGVIGAWVYDDELGEKVGLAYDGVQRGKHADLLRPIRDPILGISIPYRALDEEELALAKKFILEAYDGFVTMVAEGRDLSEERVREIAQGRVWMGGDAVERGLCDRFGGLGDAIALARERAGLPPEREVELVEYPPRPFIDFAALIGGGKGFGFPFGLNESMASLFARLAAVAPGEASAETPLDPGAFDYTTWYLQSLDGRMGQPRVILPPDVLPVGWGQPN